MARFRWVLRSALRRLIIAAAMASLIQASNVMMATRWTVMDARLTALNRVAAMVSCKLMRRVMTEMNRTVMAACRHASWLAAAMGLFDPDLRLAMRAKRTAMSRAMRVARTAPGLAAVMGSSTRANNATTATTTTKTLVRAPVEQRAAGMGCSRSGSSNAMTETPSHRTPARQTAKRLVAVTVFCGRALKNAMTGTKTRAMRALFYAGAPFAGTTSNNAAKNNAMMATATTTIIV